MTNDDFRFLFNNAINKAGYQGEYDSAARQLFELFSSHVRAGFTEEQAMDILLTILSASFGGN